MIPLSMILAAGQLYIWMLISVIILMARDFVKPFSMDYIYSSFNNNEIDYIWGILGSVPAIFTVFFSIILKFIIFDWNWHIALYISIIMAVGSFILAYHFLPELKEHAKN